MKESTEDKIDWTDLEPAIAVAFLEYFDWDDVPYLLLLAATVSVPFLPFL